MPGPPLQDSWAGHRLVGGGGVPGVHNARVCLGKRAGAGWARSLEPAGAAPTGRPECLVPAPAHPFKVEREH